MIHFFKYVALAIGVAFNGNAVENLDFSSSDFDQHNHQITAADTLKQDIVHSANVSEGQILDSNESRLPEQPGHYHSCGHNHSINVMREIDPDYDKKLEHYTNVVLPQLQKEGQALRENGPNRMMDITMPIVFHIIHKPGEAIGSGQNLSDQTIIDQLETLNEDLTATNAGWPNVPPRWENIKGNPAMQFCLAEFDPQGQPTSGIVRHEYQSVPDRDFIRTTIKPQTGWPTLDYYNVWILPIPGTTQFGGVLGWAYFPFPGTPGGTLDGTVQDYRFTGKGGKTLTHEVGHSFGLPHLWGNSGGCGNDDGIADTPLQGENTNSIQRMSCNGQTWPTAPSTCGEEHMYINYMDYSPDACALTFTIGQSDVMRAIANGTSNQWASRNQLVVNAQSVAQSCQIGVPTGGGNPTGGGGGGPVITLEHDAGIQTIINPVNGEFCSAEEITPRVLLVNGFGDTPLTSCTIRYKISGTPGSIAFNWTGNLEKGESEEVELAPFTSPAFSFELTAWTTSPNGEQDENGFNDEKAISLSTPEVFDANIFEDFEDENDLPTSTNLTTIDVGNNIREWDISDESAYGVGSTSVFFRNFNSPDNLGSRDIIEFPVMDFSEFENPRLAFDIAYENINTIAEKDSLEISVSVDCGQTFTVVYKEGGEDLATVNTNVVNEFEPLPEEWRNEVIELFEFGATTVNNTVIPGEDRVIVRIINTGYRNNNVYLDNINLTDGCASSVQINSSNLLCGDACEGSIDLILNGFVQTPVITWSSNVEGQTGSSLNNLCTGTYSVTVMDTEFECEHIQEVDISGPDPLQLLVNGSDISFAGANNGSVNAFADGGTAPYSYQWDDANQFQGDFLSGLTPGTYCVTVTDGNGCTQEDCVEIVGFDCEIEVIVEITQPTCSSNGVGSGVVSVTNNVGPVTIFWSKGPPPFGVTLNSPTNNDLSEGEFFIRVTDTGLLDENGVATCFEQIFLEIFPANPPSISPVVVGESNNGSLDGSITLNTDDEDSVYSYLWSNGETTEDLSDLAAGTYTVTINDVNNDCELIETFVIEGLNCTLNVTGNIQNVDCFDGNNGMVSLTASGGTPPYDYLWPVGPSIPSQGNLVADIYDITVSDQGGCQFIFEAIVEQPSLLDMILTSEDESSPGAFDGTASTTVFGGTPPYEYDWSNGDMDVDNISGLSGGIYLVTVTDANGCVTVKGASVEGQMCPDITVESSASNISCFGENDGTLSGIVSGGVEPYTYLWMPGGFTTQDVSDVPPGNYELMVMDADGCPATASLVSISEPAEFTLELTGSNESSIGAMDGSIQNMVTGGVGTITYSWSGPPTFGGANTPDLSLLGPGEYCVQAFDETNCPAEACFTIGAGSDPCAGFTNESVALEVLSDVNCFGEANGSAMAITLAGTQPFTYLWSNDETGMTATSLPAGESFVTVTDANDCISVMAVNINEPTELEIVEFVSTDVLCRGEATAMAIASANGGIAPYTYAWSTLEDTESISDLEAGEYTVTITDSNDCSVTNTFEVEQPEMGLELSLSSENETMNNANDGSAFADVIGGTGDYFYMWIGPNGFIAETQIISDLEPGTYCVTITDDNQCEISNCVEVAAVGAPDCTTFGVALSMDEITCNEFSNGAIQIDVFNGVDPISYTWSNPALSGPTQINLGPGVYSVTVVDNNGCEDVATVTLTQPEFLEVDIQVQSISSPGASDGVLTAEVAGGTEPYDIVWSDGTSGSILEEVGPGEICVTVSDANGCFTEETCVTLEDPMADCSEFEVELVITNHVTCFGDSDGGVQVNIISAVEPVTYQWSDGLPATQQQTGLTAGTYTVLVTDANNCDYEAAIEVVEPDSELTIELSSTDVTTMGGQDGTATVVASGGFNNLDYTYTWSDEEFQNTATATGLAPGQYCVTVGSVTCSAVDCIEVFAAEDLCAEFEVVGTTFNASCFEECDGTVDLEIIGGQEPYDIQWSDGQTGLPYQTCAGPGGVTITDANDCQTSITFIIDEPEEIEVFANATDATTATSNDGTANALAFGGTTPFTYAWSNQETGADIDNLAPGEYTVTATDANGCENTATVTVGVMDDICDGFTAEFEVQNVSCFGAEDGLITVEVQGGSGTYLFEYSNGTSLGDSQANVGPGDFTIVVTDENDCEVVLQGTVTEPDELIINVLQVNNTSDPTAADGSISIGIEGGTEPYEIVWDDAFGDITDVEELPAGTYDVTVRDANGCETIESITVNSDGGTMANCESLSADYLITPVSCFLAADGSIEIFPSGGTEPYDIAFSSPSFTQLISSTYMVTITDDMGCEFVDQIDLPTPTELIANAQSFDGSCGSAGVAELVINGGTQPYEILWSNGASTPVISNLGTGTYTYTIEDANGCVTDGSVDVTNQFIPIDFEVTTTNATCSDTEDGSISVVITEGVEPYTFLWNDGVETRNRVNIGGGEYTLQITDGAGCQFVLSRTILSPSALVASYSVDQGATNTLFDVTVNASGGTPPYQYDWSDGSNNFLNLGLTIGTYTVTITDDNDCEEIIEVELTGTTSTLDNLDIISSFDLSPNPTNGQFFIDVTLNKTADVNVVVYDILGQQILNNAYRGDQINDRLDLSIQAAGTYYVRLFNEQGQMTKKLIKVD